VPHQKAKIGLLLEPLGEAGAFYILENLVLRKRGPEFGPELFTGEGWVPFGDTFAFDHGAEKVSEVEARKAMERLWN
jgi:hypothetical protein